MVRENFEMNNMAIRIGKISIDVVNFLMMYFVVFILIVVTWTKHTFGDVSLPQLLFFLIYKRCHKYDSINIHLLY